MTDLSQQNSMLSIYESVASELSLDALVYLQNFCVAADISQFYHDMIYMIIVSIRYGDNVNEFCFLKLILIQIIVM